jgi:23S rRNA pseudouridine2457 synthase
MVSQFISPDKVGLLGDLDFDFPEGTHAVGRLDNESEGLLILTTDKKVTRLLFAGDQPHKRTYLVMVQNEVSQETLQRLKAGIPIRIKGGGDYIAKPDDVQIVKDAGRLYARATDPREKFPHTWMLITLSEGKFRQVRKMVLAARHRCLRLIRISIGDLRLGDLAPGEVKEIEQNDFFRRVGIVV